MCEVYKPKTVCFTSQRACVKWVNKVQGVTPLPPLDWLIPSLFINANSTVKVITVQ